LPYHSYNLRYLTGGEEDEHYKLMQIVQGAPYKVGIVNPPFPTSHAKKWIRHFSGCFRFIRGERKLSVALLLNKAPDETKGKDKKNESGLVVVMLGSTSAIEVSFDAHEMNHLLKFDSMEKIFKSRTAVQWKELQNFHVRVDFEPQASGSSQLFLTDITISKIVRTSQFHVVSDAVAHHIELYVPLLHGAKPASTRSRWQRLVRDR
jgi:hypothetical protein